MPRNQLYVANATSHSILVFNSARTATGDTAPNRTITSAAAPTPLLTPTAIYLDVANDRLFVASSGNDAILIYDNVSALSGEANPNRVLAGVNTAITDPTGVTVDTTRNRLYVSDSDNQILIFANAGTTNGDIAPVGTISGASTTLNNPGALFADPVEDRLYVANTASNSILVFEDASTGNGNVAPDRTLAGVSTQLSQPRALCTDLGTDRLYVANGAGNSVLIFDFASTVTGNTAPTRNLSLPAGSGPYGVFVDVTPIVLPSTAALDGYITWDGSGLGYTAVSAGGGPYTGDNDSFLNGLTSRQFFSFDFANISSGITVNSATLRIYQAATTGSPYSEFVSVVTVDHVNYGSSLDSTSSDYGAGVLTASIGTLSSNATQEYKTLDVSMNVASDLAAGRSRTQYRLRFAPTEQNGDTTADYTQFTDAEDSCCGANRPPQLVITVEP